MEKLLSFLIILGMFGFMGYIAYQIGFGNGYQKGNRDADIWYAEALNQPQILTDPLGRYSIIMEKNSLLLRCNPLEPFLEG